NPNINIDGSLAPEKPAFETTPLNNDPNALVPATSLPGEAINNTEPFEVSQ
ncbi:hypothetical protein HON22_04225, partial [Candidatus Peregrinibacteria bacterium]|nr:hypothetical protein [Candidatus Peregrinibacteria bacterium]